MGACTEGMEFLDYLTALDACPMDGSDIENSTAYDRDSCVYTEMGFLQGGKVQAKKFSSMFPFVDTIDHEEFLHGMDYCTKKTNKKARSGMCISGDEECYKLQCYELTLNQVLMQCLMVQLSRYYSAP